ncbi:hypothetical protein [Microvirga puerhi]|uniref:Uncharacterized protein n=1 Tax=Microvirga puerhi TaxID=2876078 RepID=A0ABS7VHP1_9HYPH|nr:hypothetical protein [Microvirga puerhi]MBZ6074769.1 hypothetical protein [Microvirga puerhi]
MVADAVAPAGQTGRLADVGFAQGAEGMGTVAVQRGGHGSLHERRLFGRKAHHSWAHEDVKAEWPAPEGSRPLAGARPGAVIDGVPGNRPQRYPALRLKVEGLL